MALEMKPNCESCRASLEPHSQAYICAYECTFCPDCAARMSCICPNCGGELVPRPRKLVEPH